MKHAFTLIELLVVVLIIGILAAIALPQYEVAVGKSHLATAMPIAAHLIRAQEAYYLANGHYATVWNDIEGDLPDGVPIDENSTYFSWRKMKFAIRSSQITVFLKDLVPGLELVSYYSRSVQTNKRFCVAYTYNPAAAKVCKSAGGTEFSTGTYEGKDYVYYLLP